MVINFFRHIVQNLVHGIALNYIILYIEDIKHHVSGWIDWNLILDQSGGPNYADHFVDLAMIAITNNQEIYKQPMFYTIGYFSRFITEGSIRTSVHSGVLTLDFEQPDKSNVVILYNKLTISRITVVVPFHCICCQSPYTRYIVSDWNWNQMKISRAG